MDDDTLDDRYFDCIEQEQELINEINFGLGYIPQIPSWQSFDYTDNSFDDTGFEFE